MIYPLPTSILVSVMGNIDKSCILSKDWELHVISSWICSDSRVKLPITLTRIEVGKGDIIQIDLTSQKRERLWFTIDPWFTKRDTNTAENWPKKTSMSSRVAIPISSRPHCSTS